MHSIILAATRRGEESLFEGPVGAYKDMAT